MQNPYNQTKGGFRLINCWGKDVKAPIAAVLLFLGPLASIEAEEKLCDGNSGSYTAYARCGWSLAERSEAELLAMYNRFLEASAENTRLHSLVVQSRDTWVNNRDATCDLWTEVLPMKSPWCRHAQNQEQLKILTHKLLHRGRQ